MKRIVKFLAPILILTFSVSLFMVLRASKPELPPVETQERVWRVEVQDVVPQTLAPSLTLYGRVETPALFKAAAPAASRVQQVLVREGETVVQGQLLIALDARDFLPRLEQAQAEVAEFEAQLRSEHIRQESDLSALEYERKLLELATQSVERAQRLQSKQLGSDSELDQARQALARQALSLSSRELSIADHPARIQVLEARLDKAKAGLAQAELNLERSQVKAPYAGRIATLDVAEGNQVAANQQLLSLYDQATLELRARIPVPYLDELEQSQAAGYPLLGYSVRGSRRIELRLVRLAGEADPSGIDALFAIEQGGAWLRSGQIVQFTLRLQPRAGALAVPYSVLYGEDRAYKLVQGRMQGVRLETLGSYQSERGVEQLLIRSDQLSSGDALVITHLPNAIDGLRAEAVADE
ncbi:MAG: biotin/lipoyl-binding protein [Chromatiaceae bacterium]|nr:biotin/lipoyl-binding protein [Chromatiaceae bacterium]